MDICFYKIRKQALHLLAVLNWKFGFQIHFFKFSEVEDEFQMLMSLWIYSEHPPPSSNPDSLISKVGPDPLIALSSQATQGFPIPSLLINP